MNLKTIKQRQAMFSNPESIDYFFDKLDQRKDQQSANKPSVARMVLDWLQCKATDTCTVQKAWSNFQQPMLARAYDAFRDGLQTTKYERQHRFGEALADKFNPIFEDVVAGPQLQVNLAVTHKDWVTDKSGAKYFVDAFLQNNRWDPPSITIKCLRKHQAKARKLLSDFERTIENYNIYRNQVLAFESGLNFLKVSPFSWDELILPAGIIHEIKRATVDMLRRRAKFFEVGLGVKRSLLMEGSPGVGKSSACRALSHEIYKSRNTQATIIWVSSQSIDGARDLKQLYDAARWLAPTMLFMEDVDLIGRKRSGSSPDYLLGEWLTQMSGAEDNRGLITLATTNDMKALDHALTARPGRFDRLIQIPLPNDDARSTMLQRFAAARQSVFADSVTGRIAWQQLVHQTEGMTGDYLREIIDTAVIEAINQDLYRGKKVLLDDSVIATALETVNDSFQRRPYDLDGSKRSAAKLCDKTNIRSRLASACAR